jgi:hypothetical protein
MSCWSLVFSVAEFCESLLPTALISTSRIKMGTTHCAHTGQRRYVAQA